MLTAAVAYVRAVIGVAYKKIVLVAKPNTGPLEVGTATLGYCDKEYIDPDSDAYCSETVTI